MKYKRLGKTNLEVSQLGFGAVQICRVPETEAVNLVREAVNSGINLIDTAHAYPDSEDILGRALKGLREKVIISTKSGKTSREDFLDDLNTSLKRLNTDYLDIYHFHGASKGENLDKLINNGVVEALLEEKKKGKVRFIGFSCHNPDIIDRFYEVADFSALMIPVNFVSTEFVDKNYKKLVKNDIGIMGMKPLGGGRIEDARVSLKYINQYEKVVPVIGMQSIEELEENLKLVNIKEPLDDRDRQIIENIRKELGDKFCRGCGYCLPCQQDINIPDINYIKVFFKQFSFNEVVNPERTRVVEQVDECIECGECIERCPYSLEIIDMIKENRDYYFMRKEKGK
ncbi:MAG: aldo/keto reductase [Actinomycetia bacterium]|nr:aldo/keto reductase [Actinomycetes bacterium]